MIEVKLFSILRERKPDLCECSPDGPWEIKAGTTVSQVLEILEVDPDCPIIVLVNGCHSGKERELKDGDTLCLFPPLFGG